MIHHFSRILLCFALLSSSWSLAQQDYSWLKLKPYRTAFLSEKVKETSGLTFHKGELLTLNDGGNPSDLYSLDTLSGKILKEYPTGLKNIDFEALASLGDTILIGDFGNNTGHREDLTIYALTNDKVSASYLFSFKEQSIKDTERFKHDFDLESMAVIEGEINLFTKERKSLGVARYLVDNSKAGTKQELTSLERYNLGYMATDAYYYEGDLYMVGYTWKMEVFLSIFQADEKGMFFSKSPRKYYLGLSSSVGQVEGIAVSDRGVYISAENFQVKFLKRKQSFYFIPKRILKD